MKNTTIYVLLALFLVGKSLALSSDPSASIDVDLRPKVIEQGGAALLTVSGPAEAAELECYFLGRRYEAFSSPVLGTKRVILACSWDTEVGTETIELRGVDCFGNPFLRKVDLEIVDGGFPKETLEVAPSMADPPGELLSRIRRESALLSRVLSNVTRAKLFGSFLRPIPGKVTSPYGSKRVFNGRVRSRHSGVDLRGGVGRAVKACNRGQVVLSKELYFAGKTVILDHGMGIFSLYAHLSNLTVQRGEMLKRGQTLGYVGATGRVTGPHLHWGLKLHGMNVSPLDVLDFPLIPHVSDTAEMASIESY